MKPTLDKVWEITQVSQGLPADGFIPEGYIQKSVVACHATVPLSVHLTCHKNFKRKSDSIYKMIPLDVPDVL